MSKTPPAGIRWKHRNHQPALEAFFRKEPMATYQTDPRIDNYINSLPGWQQDICRTRDLVHAADAEVTETIKRTNRPYFTLQGNICALLAARDHVNIKMLTTGQQATSPPAQRSR
jgi:hypothetical protein